MNTTSRMPNVFLIRNLLFDIKKPNHHTLVLDRQGAYFVLRRLKSPDYAKNEKGQATRHPLPVSHFSQRAREMGHPSRILIRERSGRDTGELVYRLGVCCDYTPLL